MIHLTSSQKANVRSVSKNRLVELLRRNTTRSIVDADGSTREYRIITSGEDGMVYFWNVIARYNDGDLTKVEEQASQRTTQNMFVQVQPS